MLDDRSFAYWDPGQADWDEVSGRLVSFLGPREQQQRRAAGWQVDPGRYDLLIGRSSRDIAAQVGVEVVGE